MINSEDNPIETGSVAHLEGSEAYQPVGADEDDTHASALRYPPALTVVDVRPLNSVAYWNQRFKGDWDAKGGRGQSRYFARIAAAHFPAWFSHLVRQHNLSVCDWGCAEGDGTDFLAHSLNVPVTGVDFAAVAIDTASARYPSCRFCAEDWLITDNTGEIFDVVFSSNTLEHFKDPWQVAASIGARAKMLVAILVPYREINRIAEHEFTFDDNTIPFQFGGEWVLLSSKVIDVSTEDPCFWLGQQILLIYARQSMLEPLRLKLGDLTIEGGEGFRFKGELEARHAAYVADKEIYIAQVLDERGQAREMINSLSLEKEALDTAVEEAQSKVQELLHKTELLTRQFQTAQAEIDALSQKSSEATQQRNTLQQQYQDLGQRYNHASWELDQARRKVARIKRSTSWRMTAPIRETAKGLRTLGRKTRKWFQAKVSAYAPVNERTRAIEPALGAAPEPSVLVVEAFQPLRDDELVIISGVPFDDIGGGQRAAQLARCALKTGRKVVFLHIFKKYDFALGVHVESEINRTGLVHRSIEAISPSDLLGMISSNAAIVFEFPHPAALPFLRMAKARGIKTVFELIDDWETSLGGDWFNLDTYKEFVAQSDTVVGTAKLLVERLKDLGRADTLYLPNAANEYIFDKYKQFARPADLPARGERNIIYFGSLYGEWFAWDYVEAAALRNPTANFILIGDAPGRAGLPGNIHFLGAKLIDELPGYLQYADAAILPFTPGKISDAVSPIKVFEYMFAGKPVISTLLPEVNGYPGVHIAETSERFAELCAQVKVSAASSAENDLFIAQNSWFTRLDQICSAPKAERSVSAVILMHNNKSIIERCLETLLRHGESFLHEVIVVDNASTDDGAELVERNFPNVKLLRNPVNGCSSGRNLGAAAACGKYLAFFDSDQWFTSASFFEEALAILQRDPKIGAVGWAAGWFHSSDPAAGGPIADNLPNRAMDREAELVGYRTDIGYLATCGMFMPKAVFNTLAGFDTFYDPTCFEDTDLAFQIKKHGFELAYRDLTGIRHQPHQTTKASSQSEQYKALFKRNAAYFEQKWKVHPAYMRRLS